MEPATTNHLLMIRPTYFAQGSDTVADNSFQAAAGAADTRLAEAACREFDGLVQVLRDAGVTVVVIDDTPEPCTPDAVFCNNWFSTHTHGQLVTYPMYWSQRRAERRPDLIKILMERYQYTEYLRLEHWEEEGHFLESTGSLVLDRPNRIAYACRSNRCGEAAVQRWCDQMGYKPIVFDAIDQRGNTIYHTNVLMACGPRAVPICLDALPNAQERDQLLATLQRTHKTVVPLTPNQIGHFAGNMLAVQAADGLAWVLSSQAYHSLTKGQITALTADGSRLLHAPLDTIEQYGGGSARCMLGELYVVEE